MPAIHLSDQEFADKVLKSPLPVLVDFYASWCGPFKMAGPVVDELAEEYQNKLVIAKMDVDKNKQTAGQYGIMSIPTMVVFKQGKEVERASGFAGKEGIVKLIEKVL